MEVNYLDAVIIGGGQSGLATAYHLRKVTSNYLVLDAGVQPGGAWPHAWDSLRLFSPAAASSLPGWLMPATAEAYPDRNEAIDYLTRYEQRYGFPVKRPVQVESVEKETEGFRLHTSAGVFHSRTVIAATGTWSKPFIPDYPGRDSFGGRQIHSAHYRSPEAFRGQRVLVVGGGNSAAQILAEVSRVAHTQWVTLHEPTFLPDEVDGRYVFEVATQRFHAAQQGVTLPPASLGDIIMLDSVREARSRGVLKARRPFARIIPEGVEWPDGTQERFDAILWCTGFRPALDFLAPLNVLTPEGRVEVAETRSTRQPGLWLVGYGNWTGFASATLIGVNRSARRTAEEVKEYGR